MYAPALGDIFLNREKEVFTLRFYDGVEALIRPNGRAANDSSIHLTATKLHEQLEAGELIPESALRHTALKSTSHQEKECAKREPYITELSRLVEKGYHPTTSATLELLKNIVHDKYHIGTGKHGNSTISKWWKAYKDADFSLPRSIAPKSSIPKRLPEESEHFLNRFISDVWVKGIMQNTSRGYDAYSSAVDKANSSGNSILKASESTFRRRLKELNQFFVILNSGNYSEIQKALRTLNKRISTKRVLERVEMDCLSLNLCLVDESNEPTGNVRIYMAIDCYSRYPLSVTYETGTSEDTVGVMRSLKQILYAESNELSACGIPEKIIVDNGPGYKSEVLRDVTEKLQCELVRTPSNQPWKKPFIESFNHTLRKEFLEGMGLTLPDGSSFTGIPGYTTKRTAKSQKPPSDATLKKQARVTVNEFGRLLHEYLVSYINAPHSGLNGKTPKDVWNGTRVPPRSIDYSLVGSIFHYAEREVKLGASGTVQVNKQVFASQSLKQCYLDAKTLDAHQNMNVLVHYDPDDCRWVTVIADFACYETPKVLHLVENRALDGDDLTYRQSFDELNGEHSGVKRRNIAPQHLNELCKPPQRKRGSGKSVTTAKKNLERNLSTTDKILESNKTSIRGRKQRSKSEPHVERINVPRVPKPLQENHKLDLWDEDP